MRVLAVDPGRQKCGVAVCGPAGVLAHRVVRSEEVAGVAREWVAAFRVDRILVGNSTASATIRAALQGSQVPVEAVEERGTSLAARRRYFQDHPPRGWRRLLPLSFQVPPQPFDDYAAIVLAEAYLKSKGTSWGPIMSPRT